MRQHWSATESSLEIDMMPFYWRMSDSSCGVDEIAQRLPFRVVADKDFGYLKFEPSHAEWDVIDRAYRQNENIGFLNPQSGQLSTYGASVNDFFLTAILEFQPKSIYEIGCGAGFSIDFLGKNGFDVTGVDPSEYSRRWSERLGFKLINEFFRDGLLDGCPDFIYCNDVFEHVRDAVGFSRSVYRCLSEGGIFCIATTNSTRSIEVGDISMFEHQHVNMFTDVSIYKILREAGFNRIHIGRGRYGNTFHVVAVKSSSGGGDRLEEGVDCSGFFEKAVGKVESFARFYSSSAEIRCYVPLRCIPYLATVGDYGSTPVFDSNNAWRNKFIDGYGSPVLGLDDVKLSRGARFFVGSLTFYDEIRSALIEKGYSAESIFSVESI